MDVLTHGLLASAKELNSLLTEPLAKKVLELELSSESSSFHTLLVRLIRSLDQYVNKSRDLKYIGLVGHYSSGKSSTINSLLDLKNTVDERETDLNPTDKAITLITHPKNSGDLILMTKEGSAVPIRTSFITKDMLNDIVLSDTPGSGDPDVVNELIQDFLPVCDWIFYFITATNPLDQADIPLLSEKTHKLPFIPLSFIITRSDEFRIDKSKPISIDNLDSAKRDAFLGKLTSRLQQTLKTDTISIDRFIFIDNEVRFNIDLVNEALLTHSKEVTDQYLINIHASKVGFYRNNLSSILKFFLNSLVVKVRQCEGFLETANDNISRFDKSVVMNSEKMKLLWAKNETEFKEAFHEEKHAIEDLYSNNFTSTLSLERNFVAERKQLNLIVDQQAGGYAGKLVGDINVHFKQKIREYKSNLEANVERINSVSEEIDYLFLRTLEFDPEIGAQEFDYSKFNDQIDLLQDKLLTAVYDARGTLRYKLTQVRPTLARETTIKALIRLYDSGRVFIFDNFDQYFYTIEMYQSAVLTKNTKETIEKLRIGGQLDTLDKKFSDQFIATMKEKAVNSVYEDFEVDVAQLRQKIEILNSSASDLKNELENIQTTKKDEAPKLSKEIINPTVMVSEIIDNKAQTVNQMYQERVLSAIDSHRLHYKNYQSHLSEVTTQRNRAIIFWGLAVLIISILGFIGYRYSTLSSPTTTLGEILIGIGSTIIMEAVGIAVIYFRKNIKRIRKQKQREFIAKTKAELMRSFGEEFWSELAKKVEEKTEVSNPFLKRKINEKIDPIIEDLVSKNQKSLNELLLIFQKLRASLQTHQISMATFFNKFSQVFSQSDSNAEKISEITREIKELSIKPSFELLHDTCADLIQVDAKIRELQDSI